MATKGAQLDRKTELTFRTIETLKSSGSVFQEFQKAAANYQKANLKLAEAGKQFAEALQKVGQLQSSDVGQGIQKLADMHREIENKREVMCRSIHEDLINSLQKSAKPEEAEVAQFENEYKKVRTNIRNEIAKLEAASKKAGKKGAAALQESITQLDAKIKEADQIKADKLRNILLIERKKYCNFLTQWSPVISALIDMHTEGMKFKEQQQYFTTLAGSVHQIPADVEQMITSQAQERTFVQIQGSEGYEDYSGSYDYDTSYGGGGGGGGYDQTYDQSYDQSYDSYSQVAYAEGGQTVTALYDFAGEQAEDLSFYAGDVINLIQDDDGSGWMTGEINGATGIFPSAYVQKN